MRLKHYRPDANQKPILAALQKARVTYQVLASVGDGCSDVLVKTPRGPRLLEIKTEKGILTPDEVIFFEKWAPFAVVVRTPEEAVAAAGGPK